jgi:hypothetical protein
MSIYTTSTGGISAGWITTSSLGTLVPGEISELYVKVAFSTSTVYPNYNLVSGSLPNGLSLNRDGTIDGQVVPTSYANTVTTTSSFTVAVVDPSYNELISGSFSITVKQTTSTAYTTIYCRPFLTQAKRTEFSNFIRNDGIFVPSMLYRKFDPNFGLQEDIKIVLDFGIRQETFATFAQMLDTNFYKRQFSTGNIKTAVAKDADGSVTYELIYLEVLDKHVNPNHISIPSSILINGITYYPPSIPNMRSKLTVESISNIQRYPSYTDVVQSGDSVKLGYTALIPLCYTLPGKSATIIRKINESGFKFNTLHLDIDRIVLQNTLEDLGAKYLLLSRNSNLA